MKALETNPDGSKTIHIFPLLLFMVVVNAELVAAVWLCMAMWQWAF